MIFKNLLLSFLLLFTACGSGEDNKNLTQDTKVTLADQNETNVIPDENNKTVEAPPKVSKTVTIYLHGYSKSGYNKKGVYGDIDQDSVVDNLSEFTNLPTMYNYDENATNILAVTPYYGDHLGIKKDKGALAQIATFLTSQKRVKITLESAAISDLHESIYFLNKNAEIVFESKVTSPKVYENFGIDDAISERIVEGGALNLIKYKNENESKAVGQVIFNDFVLDNESELNVEITGYELDKYMIYDVREPSFKSSKTGLGTIALNIPFENRTFEVFGRDWSGVVKVEVLP